MGDHDKRAKEMVMNKIVEHVYIVAHKEDVSNLQQALVDEGLASTVVRGPYTEEQKGYSLAIRCLVSA